MPLFAPPHWLIDEVMLVDVVALFMSIATVSVLWYVVKKIFPDEARNVRLFLTFIVVAVPFAILVYFGAAIVNYNAIVRFFEWPEVLPLSGLLPPAIVVATVFYIGQTVWLWWDWRNS